MGFIHMNFLSEETVLRHKNYLADLRLKYSVLEKSYPEILGLDIKEIDSLRLPSQVKREAISKKSEIILHELYFNSFSDKFYLSAAVKACYGSEANFLYEIESELMKSCSYGFLLIYADIRKRLKFVFGDELSDILLKNEPILAIDLWEHAYFSDYAFDRKRYVKGALLHLNLSKINDFYKIG